MKKVNRRTIVLGPPVEVATTNDIIEYEADEDPRHEVYWRCWWHGTQAGEKDREIDISQECNLVVPVQCPLGKRKNCPNQEEEHEAIVHLARRKQTLRANDTPL